MNRRLPKWNAVRLHQDHSADELSALARGLCADPANANPNRPSIWLYTPETHRRLDAIAQAITWHLKEAKERAE